jgi:hypothetical protein
MPRRVDAPVVNPFLSIKAIEINDFVEVPPFPKKVQENLLTYISY